MVANADEENKLASAGYKYICGCDEAGMGSFAGDVYTAAVIFPIGIDYLTLLPGLNDSKQKTEEQRERLYPLIKQYAISYSVSTASVEEIDKLNIYWARFLAMRRALNNLSVRPDYVIMDGNKVIPEISTPQHAIVKGDGKSISIAAASILAKVDRDHYMKDLATKVHPDYNWANNKAYYCKKQIEAIKKYGKTIYHRQKYVEKYLDDK
jgi:ribonuclease HII